MIDNRKKSFSQRLVRLWQKMPNIKSKKTTYSNKHGFSLIEVMISVFVLSLGLVAVSILMTSNIRSSENAKNQIIASQLAQEGIELVRNLKDNNPTFTTDIASENNYRIDYTSNYEAFKNSNDNDDIKKKLYLDSNKFYSHDNSGQATRFFRKIKIDITTDGTLKTATATSYVTWNNSGFSTISGFPNNCTVGNKCVSVVSVMPDLIK